MFVLRCSICSIKLSFFFVWSTELILSTHFHHTIFFVLNPTKSSFLVINTALKYIFQIIIVTEFVVCSTIVVHAIYFYNTDTTSRKFWAQLEFSIVHMVIILVLRGFGIFPPN